MGMILSPRETLITRVGIREATVNPQGTEIPLGVVFFSDDQLFRQSGFRRSGSGEQCVKILQT